MRADALIAMFAVSGVTAALAVQGAVTAPKLSPAENRQLHAAAGFELGTGGMVSTICNQPAMPRITFVDLDGDGTAEAVAVDKNAACYGAPGDWFTVLRRDRSGRWQVIMRSTGIIVWEPTRTKGWMDARITGGGRCDRTAQFDGSVYRQSSDCAAPAGSEQAAAPAPKPLPPPVAPPSAPNSPASAPAAAASAPAANGLTVGERAAIFKAAGFTQRGNDWLGCDGDSTASIEQNDVRDLNGDGKLEAIVTEMSPVCYGNTGQGFHLLTQTAPGVWKSLYSSQGMPDFLATKANGMPELEVGGPGFCFPILRWDGKTYTFNRNHEYEPGGCANR